MVQMACGRPMCLQHDSCSWRAMFGMSLTASSHCPAAWKQPMCSRPRPHAPQPLQIEACDTCIAAPRHAPCPAAPQRRMTCVSPPPHSTGHDRALPAAQRHLRSASCTARPHSHTASSRPEGPTRGPDGMWVAHMPAARCLQLEGDVRDVIDSLQSLPSCMEAADVLSASPTCPTASADRGVRHMCRIAGHTITGSTPPPLVCLK